MTLPETLGNIYVLFLLSSSVIRLTHCNQSRVLFCFGISDGHVLVWLFESGFRGFFGFLFFFFPGGFCVFGFF